MFNWIYIYSFIPISGCVGKATSTLLFLGAHDAVTQPCFYCYYPKSSREGLHMKNVTVMLLFRYISRKTIQINF